MHCSPPPFSQKNEFSSASQVLKASPSTSHDPVDFSCFSLATLCSWDGFGPLESHLIISRLFSIVSLTSLPDFSSFRISKAISYCSDPRFLNKLVRMARYLTTLCHIYSDNRLRTRGSPDCELTSFRAQARG